MREVVMPGTNVPYTTEPVAPGTNILEEVPQTCQGQKHVLDNSKDIEGINYNAWESIIPQAKPRNEETSVRCKYDTNLIKDVSIPPEQTTPCKGLLSPFNDTSIKTPYKPPQPWAFQTLPAELLILICIHLDPISMMTASLTCRSMHAAYHSLLLTFTFRPPHSLDMQISTCGRYTLNCGLEDWFYRDAPDISWDPCLFYLLAEERLWSGLSYCEGCGKFKPPRAFEESDFEREAYARNVSRASRVPIQDWYVHWENCRRCRSWAILVFEGAEEFVDPSREFWEEPLVLGLKLPGKREEVSKSALDSLNDDEYDAYLNHYERKSDVFHRLQI